MFLPAPAAGVLLAAVLAPAQEPCNRCDLDLEQQVLFCSVAADCRACDGALEKGAREEAIQRRALVRRWRRGIAADHLEAADGGALLLRTENVDLVFAPGRVTGGPERSPHGLLHLYGRRIERIRAAVLRDLGWTASDLVPAPDPARTAAGVGAGPRGPVTDRITVCILAEGAVHRRAVRRRHGLESQGVGSRRTDGEMELLLLRDDALFPDDDALHRAVVHHGVHLLIARVAPAGALEGTGWLAAGLAHHFEARLVDGTCANTCHHGRPQPPSSFWNGDWEKAARVLVAAADEQEGKPSWLRVLLEKRLDDLDLADRAVALALVRFLEVSQGVGGEGLGRMVVAAKRGAGPEELLRPLGGIEAARSAFVAHLAAGKRP